MEVFVSFIQTVGAEVVAYYLCKKPPGSISTGGLLVFRGNHGTGLHLIAYL